MAEHQLISWVYRSTGSMRVFITPSGHSTRIVTTTSLCMTGNGASDSSILMLRIERSGDSNGRRAAEEWLCV